jgi:outer membrane protein assembly factor BamB
MFKRDFKGSIGSYFVIGLAAISVFALADNVLAAGTAVSHEFNKPGHILISDQFNNRVIETTTNGTIVWSFGLGPNDFSEQSIIGVNDAQRVGRFTLMAGTGTPPGVIPQAPGGAVDNRVILVSPKGKIVWQYGQFGQTGSAPDLLSTPVQCTWLPNFHVLITDQGNNRIIEVNLRKEIVWQYPGSNTNPADQLNNPNSAELLDNGNILISDENNSRAIEVTRDDRIVKTFTAGGTVTDRLRQFPHRRSRRQRQQGLGILHQRPRRRYGAPADSGGTAAQRRHADQRPVQQSSDPGQPGQADCGQVRVAARGRRRDREQRRLRPPKHAKRTVFAVRREGGR